jgi:hypothetical protein
MPGDPLIKASIRSPVTLTITMPLILYSTLVFGQPEVLTPLTVKVQASELFSADEPNPYMSPEEPGLTDPRAPVASISASPQKSRPDNRFRLEAGFGWSSLVVDPDVGEGFGVGLYMSWEFFWRLGVEASVYFAKNPYDEDALGNIGRDFLSGNISLGPSMRLTPANSRYILTADLLLGTYIIVPVLQENIWTMGLSGGFSFSVRLFSWFGISVKFRYHLFNLATLSGPELLDLKSLNDVGAIDRFEIPVCLAFYF